MPDITDLLDLFPKCPQWVDKYRTAKDYIDVSRTRCDGCKGLGVYTDEHGATRVCDTYKQWRLENDRKRTY